MVRGVPLGRWHLGRDLHKGRKQADVQEQSALGSGDGTCKGPEAEEFIWLEQSREGRAVRQ